MQTTRFHGLTFTTEPGLVFTPRPTSEQLVDAALARLGDRPARVADVGTGAGAIAITLALRAPAVEVWASDTCERALSLARLNAERLGAQVHVVHGDLLAALPRDLDGARFDPAQFEVIVLANNCSDASAEVVRRFAARHPSLALHVVEVRFPDPVAHIGHARSCLMDEACRRLRRTAGATVVVGAGPRARRSPSGP